ncbi:MAG: DUF2235 domain-containing protein [Vicinamibacteraceae bacterium]
MSKAIVLFSDGTGNSSAKLFKTNVWRMYEAVDLGPAAADRRPQISYYDDGVGTSSFQPLAALGGAFGWGLKRNVLDIYRYACRNYEAGDDIYAFGFSRGAFTARLVVALIAAEGLVCSKDEADLRRKSACAYRSFRRSFLPRRIQWPTNLARSLHRTATGWLDRWLDRTPYLRDDNAQPPIRFIGVWDTVSAYGGPITEITRAVDNWFFPLSMPDYKLDAKVQRARHALAIDDERDAFHPLLWDEVHEDAQIEAGTVGADRLEQVWFTGMHADVGGGYPDESLSYVSLLWMMAEAEQAGLRTLDVIKARFLALASSYGPLHDSRAGLGAYYRYQPRRIAAWLDPVDHRTLSLRDPVITDDQGVSRGLLREVRVHESVVNRIATGTDRYAPITLPKAFIVVPPEEDGENAPQADSEEDAASKAHAHRYEDATFAAPAARQEAVAGAAASPDPVIRSTPMLTRSVRDRLKDPEATAARDAATEAIWNRVWWRRITYFATLAATLLLVALPLFVARLPTPPVLADGRTWIGGVIRLLTIVLPSFAGQWVDVYADNPVYFLMLAAVILVLLWFGTRMERTLRDRARSMWRRALHADEFAASAPSWIERFRTSHRYQRAVQVFKWYVLPDVVIAPLGAVLLFGLLFAAYVQSTLPFLENGTRLCQPSSVQPADITRVAHGFRTSDLCSASFGWVREGSRYVVTFDVVEPWADATLATSPVGLSASEFPAGLGYAAAPLKRVIDAHYLQPLIEIRQRDLSRNVLKGNVQIYPLVVRQVGDSRTRFRGEFKAARNGELFLFVNDAMLPFTDAPFGAFDYAYFYRVAPGTTEKPAGNHGTACVTVESTDVKASSDGAPGGCLASGPLAMKAASIGER